jgi:hypothetical protein
MSTRTRVRTRGTRAHGTRVSETGTDMKRVEYGFVKKNSSTRVRRGCAQSVPAVPVSKCLNACLDN